MARRRRCERGEGRGAGTGERRDGGEGGQQVWKAYPNVVVGDTERGKTTQVCEKEGKWEGKGAGRGGGAEAGAGGGGLKQHLGGNV